MADKNPLPITITIATSKDLPRLAYIGYRAFLTDTHSAMKRQGQLPGTLDRGMASSPANYVSHPAPERVKVVKAIADDKIVGWICWGCPPDSGMILADLPSVEVPVDDEAEKWHRELFKDGYIDGPDPNIPGSERVAAEEKMTSDHFSAWMARMMPPVTRCMYIGGFQVDPAYQGRGVGSALLKWGLDQADRMGVFAWIHASEAAWPMVKRYGFEAETKLEIDLDEWAVGKPPSEGEGQWVGKEKWGMYTLTYGVRQPRNGQ